MLQLGALLLLVRLTLLNFTSGTDNEALEDFSATESNENPNRLQLWITISAQQRFLEISWTNAPADKNDIILLTKMEPYSFQKMQSVTGTGLAQFAIEDDGSGDFSSTNKLPRNDYALHYNKSIGLSTTLSTNSITAKSHISWISNNGTNVILAAIQPSARSLWYTTGVPFDYTLSQNITSYTGCYGYWASYVTAGNHIMATTCLRAYPRWMREIGSVISGLRLRDLFIVGSHDSGSYRPNFDPLQNETIITKYTLTQDEDIRGQLLHGARYLDIRVGYYRKTPELFFINHGVTRHRTLLETILQVKDFVAETNEIVIFGLKEFPVGFGRSLNVHRLLVQYLHKHFGAFIVHPSATWKASIQDIWSRHQNVILAYDNAAVVQEFPDLLFGSVEQRWGNVQNWSRLADHLRTINNFDPFKFSSRPVADMAELTPDTWGVILDKYGGLRKMADKVNWRVSQLYRDELGTNANVVAVDFMLGTSLMELSIDINKRKVAY